LELLNLDEIDLNHLNNKRNTALTLATYAGDEELIQMLFDTGKIELWNAQKALEANARKESKAYTLQAFETELWEGNEKIAQLIQNNIDS